jgi:hypothetical protein
MNTGLTGNEVCEYFESLSERRRELVWLRCAKLLGSPIPEFDEDDERLDEAWEQVLTEMWCTEHLRRLVDFGVLECQTLNDGRLLYITPA